MDRKVEQLRDRCDKLLAGEAEGDDTTERTVQKIKVLEKKRSQLMIGAAECTERVQWKEVSGTLLS